MPLIPYYDDKPEEYVLYRVKREQYEDFKAYIELITKKISDRVPIEDGSFNKMMSMLEEYQWEMEEHSIQTVDNTVEKVYNRFKDEKDYNFFEPRTINASE